MSSSSGSSSGSGGTNNVSGSNAFASGGSWTRTETWYYSGSGSGSGSGSSYPTTSSSSWSGSSSDSYSETVDYAGFYSGAYYPGHNRDSLGVAPASGRPWYNGWYQPVNYQSSGSGSGSGSGSDAAEGFALADEAQQDGAGIFADEDATDSVAQSAPLAGEAPGGRTGPLPKPPSPRRDPPIMLPPGVGVPPWVRIPWIPSQWLAKKVGGKVWNETERAALLRAIEQVGIARHGRFLDLIGEQGGWRFFKKWLGMDEDLRKWANGLVGQEVGGGWVIVQVGEPGDPLKGIQPWVEWWVRSPNGARIQIEIRTFLVVSATVKNDKGQTATAKFEVSVQRFTIYLDPGSNFYDKFKGVQP